MTDRDRLAADLHEIACGASARAEWDLCVRDHRHEADRLIDLGWTRNMTADDAAYATGREDGLAEALHEDRLACAKCGATDIGTRWDADYYDCLYREHKRGDWPLGGGEHLHHNCRNCGWTWAAAIAKAYREDTDA